MPWYVVGILIVAGILSAIGALGGSGDVAWCAIPGSILSGIGLGLAILTRPVEEG
jgi:hypothetical protein